MSIMIALFITSVVLLSIVNGNVIVYTQTTPHIIIEEFPDMPASFGGDLPLEGLRGLLVTGAPQDGCSNLTAPPDVENFTGKWIVLLARYNCNFEVKIRNAQLAGYDCAIVHNVNSSDLETMSAKDAQDIDIPSVFVSDLDGLILEQQYGYQNGFYIMVNGDIPFNINTHLLLPFMITVALCLLCMFIFLIVKCIKDRRRARRHRLPNRSLKKIPTCKFSKGDPYDVCAICLDDYQEGDRLRVLPCAHAYHAACVDPWLTENRRVCPVCKRRVWTSGERRGGGRRESGGERGGQRAGRTATDSDSEHEPLVGSGETHTEGGTFDTQPENPFVVARRFIAFCRSRGLAPNNNEETSATNNDDSINPNNDEEAGTVTNVPEDEQPLLQPAASSERESRRSGRNKKRARRHTAPPTGNTSAASAMPPPPPLIYSADHSINRDGQGELGVIALPAPAQPPQHPRL